MRACVDCADDCEGCHPNFVRYREDLDEILCNAHANLRREIISRVLNH